MSPFTTLIPGVDRSSLKSLVYGVVGAVIGAVASWLATGDFGIWSAAAAGLGSTLTAQSARIIEWVWSRLGGGPPDGGDGSHVDVQGHAIEDTASPDASSLRFGNPFYSLAFAAICFIPSAAFAEAPVAFQVRQHGGQIQVNPVAVVYDTESRSYRLVPASKWDQYTIVVKSGGQTLLIDHGVDVPDDPDAPDDPDSPPGPPKDDLSAIKAKAAEWAKLVPAASQGKFPAVQSAIRSAATAIRNGTLKTDKEADQALRVLLFNAVQGDFGWVAAGTAMNAEIERLKKAGLIPDVETYAVVLTYIADGMAP